MVKITAHTDVAPYPISPMGFLLNTTSISPMYVVSLLMGVKGINIA